MHAPERRPSFARALLPACVLVAVAGCTSLAPDYKAPSVATPAAYKEPAQAAGDSLWTAAKPAAGADRGAWWTVFGNAQLDALEARIDDANPTLAIALARYDQARAYAGESAASLAPHIGFAAAPQRERQSDDRPLRGSGQPAVYDANTAQFTLDYEIDFWGKVRNEVAAGKAQEQAAGEDLATARLGLHAQLADLCVQLDGADVQARILADAIAAYRQALALTQNRFEGGVDSALAVSRARTQLSDALAQADEVHAQRALLEHAIATLVGAPASGFDVPVDAHEIRLPAIPSGVPSALLQRRPDIAAAERRAFAANAGIGVARAAAYPSFSLSALVGWQNAGHGNLVSAGNTLWSLGPTAAASLFDGGLRKARDREARAAFDIAAAQYRATVLSAFQQVEDELALLDGLGREARDEHDAAASAQDSQALATNRYREGAVNYLDVVTAQTSTLQAQRQEQQVRTRQLQASVGLIRALGGGWTAPPGRPA
jgi:multidrug efflux system outer membrane protein